MTTASLITQTAVPEKRDASLAAKVRLPEYVVARVDVARGVFAAFVAIAHALDVARVVNGAPSIASPLLRAVDLGIYWVMGFFVISGYCIQLSLGRLFETNPRPFRNYCVARITRILPLYYIGLIAAVIVESIVASHHPAYWTSGLDGRTLGAEVLLLHGWLESSYGCYASSWSISYEMFYYAFYGLLALAFAARFRTRAAWVGLISSAVLAAVIMVIYFLTGKHGFVYRIGYTFALGIDWFIGVLIALYADQLAKSPIIRNLARLWPVLILLTFFFECCTPWLHENQRNALLAIPFGLMVIDFYRPPSRPWSKRWLGIAGVLGLSSYPIYLFHGPVVMLFGTGIAVSGAISDWRISWVALSCAGIGVGLVLAFVAEAPLLRWRGRLLKAL